VWCAVVIREIASTESSFPLGRPMEETTHRRWKGRGQTRGTCIFPHYVEKHSTTPTTLFNPFVLPIFTVRFPEACNSQCQGCCEFRNHWKARGEMRALAVVVVVVKQKEAGQEEIFGKTVAMESPSISLVGPTSGRARDRRSRCGEDRLNSCECPNRLASQKPRCGPQRATGGQTKAAGGGILLLLAVPP